MKYEVTDEMVDTAKRIFMDSGLCSPYSDISVKLRMILEAAFKALKTITNGPVSKIEVTDSIARRMVQEYHGITRLTGNEHIIADMKAALEVVLSMPVSEDNLQAGWTPTEVNVGDTFKYTEKKEPKKQTLLQYVRKEGRYADKDLDKITAYELLRLLDAREQNK